METIDKKQPISNEDAFRTPPIKHLQHKRLLEIGKEETLKSPPILKIPASPMMMRLGYGTGVGVYLMERSPKASGEIRSPWAIKKLAKIREAKKTYSARLEYEATILKQLNHPHIVSFRAFEHGSLDGSDAYLALESANTSLADLIEGRMETTMDEGVFMPNPFPAKTITKVAADMANALTYLHIEKRMIHGDLKSANVLIFGDVDAEFVAKLCDFGVARKLKDDDAIEGHYVGTEIWNPMEVILDQRGEKKYPITSKVDIYPFGLTIYEMISLKPPHMGTADDTCANSTTSMAAAVGSASEASFDESLFEEMLSKVLGTRPLLPDVEFDDSYNKVLEIFYCCTEENPSKRPTADEIYQNLCGLKIPIDFGEESKKEEPKIKILDKVCN